MLLLKHLFLLGTLIVAFSVLVSPPVISSAEQSKEIAARALLGEAEKLIELALPQEALPVLDKVRADYPDTEAAAYAVLRRAQALMFLHKYDEAIEQAAQITAANPGKIIACWAQCVVGQSLVLKGQVADGVRELWKVPSMLPDQSDLGPMNEAREVLGRIARQYLADRREDLDAAEAIGLNRHHAGDKAKLLAILAAYRAREGDFVKAKETLSRLASECADQVEELKWANAEVTMYCIDRLNSSDAIAREAAETLYNLCASFPSGHQSGARACLSLARFYRQAGDVDRAIAVLERARNDFGTTANAAEMLYELGHLLLARNRTEEAIAVLNQIVIAWPRSGYAAPALYTIGTCARTDQTIPLQALSQLTDESYSRRWRAMAFWKLGDLLRSEDKARAKTCYEQAICLFRDCLQQDIADQGNWQAMLNARISAIEFRLAGLESD